jgi:hypothetical protein
VLAASVLGVSGCRVVREVLAGAGRSRGSASAAGGTRALAATVAAGLGAWEAAAGAGAWVAVAAMGACEVAAGSGAKAEAGVGGSSSLEREVG